MKDVTVVNGMLNPSSSEQVEHVSRLVGNFVRRTFRVFLITLLVCILCYFSYLTVKDGFKLLKGYGLGDADAQHEVELLQRADLAVRPDLALKGLPNMKALANLTNIDPLLFDPDGDAERIYPNLGPCFTQRGPDRTYTNIMTEHTPVYLTNYKNPCWMERLTTPKPYEYNMFKGQAPYSEVMKEMERKFEKRLNAGLKWRIRCLPYYYLAGVAKSMTTDLYNRLILHPDVAKPPSKEPQFWSKYRTGWVKDGYVPLGNYVDLFDMVSEEIRQVRVLYEGQTKYFHPMIFGDGSVSTFGENDWWYQLPENMGVDFPKYHVSHYIRQIQSDAKIIVIFRNPTDRLYSDYQFFGHDTKSPELFQHAVIEAIQGMEDCIAKKSVIECVFNRTLYVERNPSWKHAFHIRTGMYHVFLEEVWLRIFPRDQILVLHMEDYQKNMKKTLSQVYDFLGLDPLPDDIAQSIVDLDIYTPKTESQAEIGPMLDSTREILDAFYRPYNERLAEALNDKRFLWKS